MKTEEQEENEILELFRGVGPVKCMEIAKFIDSKNSQIVDITEERDKAQKELSDFKALVKQMRERQDGGAHSNQLSIRADLETQVDKYLQE